MSGLAPSVANLFASHSEAQQTQTPMQPPPMHPYHPHPMMAPPPPHMSPMHAQAYPGPPPPPPHHGQPPPTQFPQHDPFGRPLQGPPPQPFPFQQPPPPQPQQHMFPGQPFPQQQMMMHPHPHPHAQMMQHPHQQPTHPQMYVSPPAPPPSRQVSQLDQSQVSGPGSLLSMSAEAEAVASAVGVAIASDHPFTLSLSPDDKHLGGDEHASTPCAELSSIPRTMDEPVGCLIAHQAGVTVFALKAGLARLLYAPSSKSVDAHSASSSDAQQSEVLKGHGSSVLDIAFLPQETSEELAIRGVKLEAGQRASFVATLSSSLMQVYQITFTEGQTKVAAKLAFSVPGQQMARLRIGRTAEGRSTIAVLSSAGSLAQLNPWPLLSSLQDAAAAASAMEPLPFSGSVVDVTWVDRTPLVTDGKSWTHAGAMHFSSSANPIERVIAIPNTTSVLVVSTNAEASSKTLRVHRLDGELVSSVTLTHADLLFSAVEVAPTGEFVAVAYRRSEATGEASDAGFFVLQLSSQPRGVPADTRVFVFVSVFFQPSPIVSFSLAAAEANDGSFDVFAVEQKPIVRLHIARQAVARAIQADEVRRSAAVSAISASALLAASTSSGIAHGQGEVTGDEDEHRDAVPALRSSLPPRLAAQGSSHSDSPPSPAIVEFSGAAAAVSSAPSSASNSRMQSPAVSRVDRPDFNQIDHPLLDGSGIDYSSGRSSPSHATSSPLKPVLRPRGNSTGETGRGVHFAAGGPASSQPTPNSTPGPGTPSGIRGMSSLESSEASSPLPSPLPSPRGGGSLAGSRGLSDPSSPFQPHTGSVATTTDVSAAQSPFVSSNSSPLISPSPTPVPHVLDESGITSIPSTPSHHAQAAPGSSSSTVTPAPTPHSTGGVRLSQMSTADVSLHFLSAVSHDPNRSGAGGAGHSTINTPMNTPMVTPASSVPNTPRGSVAVPPRKSSLVGGSFSLGTSGVNVAPTSASSVLRVRTQSGSTSPSPISSPSFASSGVPSSGQKYHRVRSQSMDKADSFSGGRMLAESAMVEPVPEEGAAPGGPSSPADMHPPRPSSASSGLVTKPIVSAHDSTSKSSSSSGKQSQEQNLVRVLDQLFGRHIGRLSGIIASERLQMAQEERQRMEQLTAMLVQNVSSAVGDRVAEVMEGVCESSLLPAVTEALEQRLSAAGGAGVGAGASAGASVDSASIVAALRAPLQDSFRSAFVSTLLPSFESSIKQMLVQIQSSVQGVTAQASAASSKSAADEANQAAQRRRAEEEEKKARQFERAESARREKALSAQVAEMHEIITALAQSQLKLTQSVTEMKGMIAAGAAAGAAGAARVSTAAASSSSPVAPPTPSSVDLTSEIGSLLQAEQFDRAFTLALSSGKLKAVKFACAQLDPRTLLTTTVAAHRLSSPVVLSLIQQLAASLQVAAAASLASPTDSDLRVAISWLRESVMAVKVDDPTIAAHVKPILKQASAQAEQLQLPAHHPMFDSLRMLQQLLQLKSA